MDPRNPPPKNVPNNNRKPKPPRWSSLLWFWQSTISQFSYRTIPYSEFLGYLKRHEVVRCVVRDDDIQGEIFAKPGDIPGPATLATNSEAVAKAPATGSKAQ